VGFEPTVTLLPQWFQEHARFAVHQGSYFDVQHLGPRVVQDHPAYIRGECDDVACDNSDDTVVW
jgi:hypothetical protein